MDNYFAEHDYELIKTMINEKIPYWRKNMENSEVSEKAICEVRRWLEIVINTIDDEEERIASFCITPQSYSHDLDIICGNQIVSDIERVREMWIKIDSDLHKIRAAHGVYLFLLKGKKCVEERYISQYNPNVFHPIELVIYQEYGLEPEGEYQKKCLNDAIKEEKVKKTLVYACFLNDNNRIMELLSKDKISKNQLNMRLNLYGTPLQICAQNNNLEAFKAIAEKGADIGKSVMGGTALDDALRYSFEIVCYIYENYREQFDKEILAKYFGYFCKNTNYRLLQMIKETGLDLDDEGKKIPTMHNFAKAKNLIGLQFLIDNGANINSLDKEKKTALDLAEQKNLTEVAEFLRQHNAKHGVDII